MPPALCAYRRQRAIAFLCVRKQSISGCKQLLLAIDRCCICMCIQIVARAAGIPNGREGGWNSNSRESGWHPNSREGGCWLAQIFFGQTKASKIKNANQSTNRCQVCLGRAKLSGRFCPPSGRRHRMERAKYKKHCFLWKKANQPDRRRHGRVENGQNV